MNQSGRHRTSRAAYKLTLLWLLVACVAHAERPNIVLILADDLGYGDLGCYSPSGVATPAIDRLASEGIRFTQFYASPMCTPTRAALLTGRYEHRVGGLECAIGIGNTGRYPDAIRLRRSNSLGLPASDATLAKVFKAAGYVTGLTGKWHLGYEEAFSPERHGFEHAFYCPGGEIDYFQHAERGAGRISELRLNGQLIERNGYFTDLVADEAVSFIAKNRDHPFFLYVPLTAPHSPYQGPGDRRPEPLPEDSPLWDQSEAPPEVYAAMVARLDQAVGRILDGLNDAGLAQRTLVVFLSDNGGTASARPSGLRGRKGTTFEGGVRVPCIVRWPDVFAAGTVSPRVGMVFDLTVSMVRIAGAKTPEHVYDGIDVLAPLERDSGESERSLFWRSRRGDTTWKAVRAGSLKYVLRLDNDRTIMEGLFDLGHDEAEQHDLRESRPADAARLRQLLTDWEARMVPVQ